VLHRLADGYEQLQPLANRQASFVAECRNWLAARDERHDEVGPAGNVGSGVEDRGDVRMIHDGQCLTLTFKASDDRASLHSRLDELRGHSALDLPGLLGFVDGAHAAMTELLQ